MSRAQAATQDRSTVGIIAGGGSLPIEVAQGLIERGRHVHLIGLAGTAEPEIARFSHTWIGLAGVNRGLAALKANRCQDIVIVGHVKRPDVWKLRPDLGLFKIAPTFVRMLSGGDDAVHRQIIRFFETQGFVVRAVEEVAPWLLMPEGPLGTLPMPTLALSDAAHAAEVVAALGPFDVGQAVAVEAGQILAVEGAEGTDGLLKRVASLPGRDPSAPRGLLLKFAKPGQERRVDLPVIGPRTVEGVIAAGLSGLVLGARAGLIAERPRVCELADRSHRFIWGLAQSSDALAAPDYAARAGLTGDAAKGAAALLALQPFCASQGLVIVRGHILGLETGQGLAALLASVEGLRQWGLKRTARRSGLLVLNPGACDPATFEATIELAAHARLASVSLAGDEVPAHVRWRIKEACEKRGLRLIVAERAMTSGSESGKVRLFVIAGEHSGDVLGGRLMAALRRRTGDNVSFEGIGGEVMSREGLHSIYPISDIAVMGLVAIVKALPFLYRRGLVAVDAALAASPDAVIIIDAPEFTHRVARRIRRARPDIPIINYVSPTVWAWRPGRSRAMRPYVDHLLALLPFEPKAHAELNGPPTTYVGHPMIEHLAALQAETGSALAQKLGLDPKKSVLVVLPGSRTSEVNRLIGPFRLTIDALRAQGHDVEVVIPAVPHVRKLIEAGMAGLTPPAHLIDGEAAKWQAFRLARAALAASGTVTLELAVAGTPMVVAYKVDKLTEQIKYVIRASSVVLANLVLGRNAFPEYLQGACNPDLLSGALRTLMADGPARDNQLAALAEIPGCLEVPGGSPSDTAADVVISVLAARGVRFPLSPRMAGSGDALSPAAQPV